MGMKYLDHPIKIVWKHRRFKANTMELINESSANPAIQKLLGRSGGTAIFWKARQCGQSKWVAASQAVSWGAGRGSACGARWANIRSTGPGDHRRVFAWLVFEGALLAGRGSVHAPGR